MGQPSSCSPVRLLSLALPSSEAHPPRKVPVVRPQDIAKPGPGTIALAPDDPLIVLGVGTSFMADFEPKKKILLGKAFGGGTGDVAEVLDDNRLRLVKPFSAKTMEALSQHLVGAPYKVRPSYPSVFPPASNMASQILPHVDQSEMYASVFRELEAGGSLGIFPEGGSHDRTTLLPLKAGVSIMALGALEENPSLQLKIVPVGLSYFHPQKFRSRAVVEFGSPIEIPREMIDGFTKGGVEKHAAVSGVMALIVDGLKSVTVRAPDYETLMVRPGPLPCAYVNSSAHVSNPTAHSGNSSPLSPSRTAPFFGSNRRPHQAFRYWVGSLQGYARSEKPRRPYDSVQHPIALHGLEGSPGASPVLFFPSRSR